MQQRILVTLHALQHISPNHLGQISDSYGVIVYKRKMRISTAVENEADRRQLLEWQNLESA